MKTVMSKKIGLGLLALTCSLTSCNNPSINTKGTRKISFVLTNDLHGHLEPITYKNGNTVGGMAYLGNIVDSIRKQPEYVAGDAGLIVLDSGDQFQGTLLSNYNEGKAMFSAMNEVGYDAAVPGNHDYDFGPLGWLYDKVSVGQTSNNPREVIEGLAASATFPLLSANTYFKNSIHFQNDGATLSLDSQCKLKSASSTDLDFGNASRPSFLKPYVILQKADVRVALIGLDNHATASTTAIENIDDLCFRDEVDTYLEIRKSLEGKADIFVLMMHNGNSDNSKEASEIVKKINEQYPNGVHLAAAGHTHFTHNDDINGVRVMQDGAENKFFGRVDLYFDMKSKSVLTQDTASKAGISIDHDQCKEEAVGEFCKQYSLPLVAKPSIQSIIDESNKVIAPLAKQVLGSAKEPIGRSRISESAMSNILTDALRAAANTQISFMNTGGIRADLAKGQVLYEDLFEVLPFSNLGVVMNSVPWSVIKKVLTKSIQTCGKYGALMQSGLKVRYTRTCKSNADVDYSAKLTHVSTLDGRVLLNADDSTEINPTETFSVATLDFLASGGSGYEAFKEASVSTTLGIARELIVEAMLKAQPLMSNQIDGRFQNITP